MSLLCTATGRGHEFDCHEPGWLSSWRICRDCGERQNWDPGITGFIDARSEILVVTKARGQWTTVAASTHSKKDQPKETR